MFPRVASRVMNGLSIFLWLCSMAGKRQARPVIKLEVHWYECLLSVRGRSIDLLPSLTDLTGPCQVAHLFVVKKMMAVSKRPMAAKNSSALDLGPAKITRSSCPVGARQNALAVAPALCAVCL